MSHLVAKITWALLTVAFCLTGVASAGAAVILSPAAGYSITWNGNDGDYFNPAVPASAPASIATLPGVTAFGSSEYGAGVHLIANANDGLYGNSNSWLAAGADTNPYIGLNLGGIQSIGAIAWSRDNGNNVTDPSGGQLIDRYAGTYTLQYTQVVGPGTGTTETGNPATGWADIGTVQYGATSQAGFTPYLRHEYEIAAAGSPIQATGVRIKVPDAPSFNDQIAIDEVELYAAATSPPPIPTAGLSAWLAADRGVHTIAGKVDSWADQSGNGNDLTIVAGDTSPGYQAIRPSHNSGAGAGGKDLIHFDGTQFLDTYLSPSDIRTAGDLGMLNSDYEMFVVIQSGVSQVAFPIAGNAGEQYEIHTNGPGGARFIPTNGKYADVGSTGQYLDGRAHILGGRVEASGVGFGRADGVDSAGLPGSFSTSDVYLNVGQRVGGGYRYNGDIAEILIYDRALTPTERVQVEQYLSRRWYVHYTPPGFSLAETGGSLVPWNVAGQSLGGVAFAKDVLPGYAAHQIAHLNDETYGNNNSWIAGSANSFAGVAFDQAYAINAIAFGRDNGGSETTGGPANDGQFTDRFLGVYSLQYTRVPNPDQFTPDSDWIDIATLDYDGAFPDATGYLRHLYRFDPIFNVTGVRILTSANGIAIDEIEVNAVPEPAAMTLALLGLAGLAAVVCRRRRGRRGTA